MKKKISIGIVVIILVLFLIMFAICYNKIKRGNEDNVENNIVNNEEDDEKNEVYIKDGKITNENLIDEFVEKIDENQDAELIINEDDEKITLEYFIGDNDQEYNGYYSITINEGETQTYDALHWSIKRKTTDNIVNLEFYPIEDTTEIPVICKYNLDSAEYEKIFELTYTQRKDLGVYKIAEKNEFDNEDYGIYTFAGNVEITIEDEVYNLKVALEQEVITAQDIINQANLDYKYGICDMGYYSDGGSIEYLYDGYTILKYNTLDSKKDLVIGMKGTIINQLNKN